MRLPGVKPGAQAWEACMLPLRYRRSSCMMQKTYRPYACSCVMADCLLHDQNNCTRQHSAPQPARLFYQRSDRTMWQVGSGLLSFARQSYAASINAAATHHTQLAVWSSGMILASGARGPGLNSQNSPLHFISAGS